jgi:hypothetical protein
MSNYEIDNRMSGLLEALGFKIRISQLRFILKAENNLKIDLSEDGY